MQNNWPPTIQLYLALSVLFVASCSAPTFYAKTYEFNESLASGNLDEAERIIADYDEKKKEGRNKFLYLVNAGMVEHLQGDFENSNSFFQEADLFVEDFRKDALKEGASFLLNPNLSTYPGEDHEILLINYYKALNYYILGDKNAALVEVRRLNLALNRLSEKYTREEKYQRSAYMHLLMALIYESNNEYNNAFISFRNAYEIYESDYTKLFGIGAPQQLKEDLIRSAALGGLPEEKRQYEKEFGISYDKELSESSFVLLWHNGLGPVKEEWGINFAVIRDSYGWVVLVNEEYGMSFPFYVGDTDMSAITWIKVVFPRYVEREEFFTQGIVRYQNQQFALELAENINAVSFNVLNERMLAEFSKSLIRVALKQLAAKEIGQANDSPGLGAALSVLASATESADTRNWQTIPHSIYYKRVPVSAGQQTLEFDLYSKDGTPEVHFLEVNIPKGETIIYPFYSLGAYPPKFK